MSLPDIDTTSVSFIAYWNILEQGANDSGPDTWDPSSVTTYGAVNSYSSYSNGVEGSLSLGSGRNATFRTKDDGWMVVYLDRYEDEFIEGGIPQGPWDFSEHHLDDAYNHAMNSDAKHAQATLNEDSHTIALKGLYDNSDISGDANVTWDATQVGFYNYWHTGTNVTVMGSRAYKDFTGSSTGTVDDSPTLEFADGTTVHYHAIAATAAADNHGGYKSTVGGTNSPSTQLLYLDSSTNTEDREGSARRASNIDYAQNTGVTYDAYIQANNHKADYAGATCHQLQAIVWS